MSCVLSAPSTDNGKTTLALLISCWAYSKGLKIQTFKVGPDYLDQQQLSSIGHPICRNLDIFLSGEDWIKKTFIKYSQKADFSLVEGAMGLFDGLGSTDYSSTANVAKILDLPIILIVDAKGKVRSLLPIVRGFQDFDKKISIKGIVFNNVSSERHQELIKEVFKQEPIEIMGFLPFNEHINLKHGNLGLISPSEIEKKIDINYFSNFAEKHLNFSLLHKFLKPLRQENNPVLDSPLTQKIIKKPIAIAEDRIFHFQYPETKEFFEEIGIPTVSWSIYKNEKIPKEAIALIIPGGFPEKYAEEISLASHSLNSLKEFYKRRFIYAECGGMMILGDLIKDENGKNHKMAGIIPFSSRKGKLSVGYRYLKGAQNSPLIKQSEEFKGHEFHYWQLIKSIENHQNSSNISSHLNSPWEIRSWGNTYKLEGWANENLHASWVHLHFPSNKVATSNFLNHLAKQF